MTNFDGELFDPQSHNTRPPPVRIKQLNRRVWTTSKVQLIRRYLEVFVQITKNCYYIDAFSGPQNDDRDKSWAAKNVMELTPKWAFRKFALFELNTQSIGHLEELKRQHESGKERQIWVVPGDCNITLPQYLAANPVREKEATFCLLDQRTNECDWATVEAVARHKTAGTKIEIFYFLPAWWFERFVSALKTNKEECLRRWWGREDYDIFTKIGRGRRAEVVANRLKTELGYKHAMAYPIYEDAQSSKIMFHMIHATDHDAAPELMVRAYNNIETLGPIVTQQEMEMFKNLYCPKQETDLA